MSPRVFDVDKNVCQAYGICAAAAPEHIELDDDGEPIPLGVEFEETPDTVALALSSCPTGAAMIRDSREEQ